MSDKILNFKGSWREYQKRILDNLEFHLMDDKLHVVAAPGAGKTTLGIEVISRLNRPTLILAPTNTIKNQWKDRICTSFLEEDNWNLVSTDIKKPAYITVITYQALLAAFCGNTSNENEDFNEEEEEIAESDSNSLISSKRFNKDKADEIIKLLKKTKISLLCFDEAHHLRKEWWKALMYLNEELRPEQTLALTATPPYDADINEWQRYEELCGEIDEVISIPELVKNNDLCPHQDFIYLSVLKDSEKELLKKLSINIQNLEKNLKNDEKLINYLKKMQFLITPEEYTEQIFDDPDFYISITSLLNSLDFTVPKNFLKLFDAKQHELPKFDTKRLTDFLNGFLFSHTQEFEPIQDKVEEYIKYSKHSGLIHNRKIVLKNNIKIQRQIAGSLSKLDSIVDIVNLETSVLGSNLRMVVLTDFIRANDNDSSHLGVVPIWRVLKTKYNDRISLGVLCGSLILIPKSKQNDLQRLLSDENIQNDGVSITEYSEDSAYIKITPKESTKNKIVKIITEMFNRGDLTILVGTQALLGEGWDAPCINSLILSSTVSSYMLSNQMRGRAIRIDKNCPDKISNIWHLATIAIPQDTDGFISPFSKIKTDIDVREENDAIWYDLNQLSKRFDGYEAPSYFEKHEIVSGISRVMPLNNVGRLISKYRGKARDILNSQTTKIALDRQQTKQWWKDALYLGYNKSFNKLRTGVEAETKTMRTLCYTSYKEIVEGIMWMFLSVVTSIPLHERIGIPILGICILIFSFLLLRVYLKFLKTGTVAGVMKQIGIVMLESLSYEGLIKTSLKKVGLSVEKNNSGSIYVSCANLPTEENNLFIKCMQEFLNPVENPRYILIKHEKYMNLKNQTDYFSIPAVLSSNKKTTKLFKKLWEKYIGDCDIIYTRNLEGRKILLKARKEAFSATKREKSKKLSKWQ